MPLMAVEIGHEVVIEACHLRGDVKRHMDSLGIFPGEKITPIAKNAGNLIIKVRESRLAIGMGVASKIYVK